MKTLSAQAEQKKLAIVAGGGVFPRLVAEHANAALIVRLQNDATDLFSDFDSITARPEQLGYVFDALRKRDIHDIVMIGHMKRPALFSLRPDATTLAMLPHIIPALCFGGDDALLRAVRRMLESRGFNLHAPQSYLNALLAPHGSMGAHVPDAAAMADIDVGRDAARALGLADTGQAVIVLDGVVLGHEDRAGTDALIARCGKPGAILVKTAKPQQDRALDLPSIGPDTIRNAAAMGLKGIAVEAGATLLANRQQTVELADTHGIFLIGIS